MLANDYGVNSSILFQYVPNWISSLEDNDDLIDKDNLLEVLDGVNTEDVVGDLTVVIYQESNDYRIFAEYSDKFSKEFIERFVESYKMILHDFICVEKLRDVNYISSSDLKLLDNYNKTEHPLEHEDILDAFNDNLAQYSDNILVSFNEKKYTYGEGAFIADNIAKNLLDLGVNPSDCVGFLTERSEKYMFSVLGILSCGGVYVPLDDKLPDERIEFILEDSNCKVVIVSDDTYERVNALINDSIVLLNISDIVDGEIGSLSSLPVVYGDLACI